MKFRYLLGLPFISMPIKDTEIECIIDTGFNGFLMLPKQIILELGGIFEAHTCYALADNNTIDTELYSLHITWFNQPLEVIAVCGESEFSLVGMSLLHNTELILRPFQDFISINHIA